MPDWERRLVALLRDEHVSSRAVFCEGPVAQSQPMVWCAVLGLVGLGLALWGAW